MKSKLIAFAATLFVAAVATHTVAVLFMPEMLLAYVVGKLPGEVNQHFHSPRITDESRRVVRPSPDLLYSICPYDLAAGETLRISARAPTDTYISLALYDESTNNFFLLNRRELSAGPRPKLDLVYAPEARDMVSLRGNGDATHTVRSPTRAGVALFRILLKAPEQYEALRAFQESQKCTFIAAPNA